MPQGAIFNDDLDIQLVWLRALQEYGPDLTARELADTLLAGWQAGPRREASDLVKRLAARVNRIEDQLKRKGLGS